MSCMSAPTGHRRPACTWRFEQTIALLSTASMPPRYERAGSTTEGRGSVITAPGNVSARGNVLRDGRCDSPRSPPGTDDFTAGASCGSQASSTSCRSEEGLAEDELLA